MKYSDLLMGWLNELGYTHCFFVAGGNSMHLLDGARQTMTCIPVVHEVAAGIAAEYFNERARAVGNPERAFAMVTAGPGLTNILTAMAGAYLESRDLLVLGGQVKSTDLAGSTLRQRGIQEIDGLALAAPISVTTQRIETPADRRTFTSWVLQGTSGRPGPVFIEICLDAQGAPVDPATLNTPAAALVDPHFGSAPLAAAEAAIRSSQRPVLLLGGGVSRLAVQSVLPRLREQQLPTMTTWNGADRLGADDPIYAGRPNTWGQRGANVVLQQADLVIALGTRLGLQQTGFNWQQFAPVATVIQVDIDRAELEKGHPRVDIPWHGDADQALQQIVGLLGRQSGWGEWLDTCAEIRSLLPNVEETNTTAAGYLDPFRFVADLSARCVAEDIIVPGSSGGAFTVAMQAFEQKAGQTIITDKGLASMGYGLSGAIGAALASPGTRTVHLEGDGGFVQNLQEMATVAVNSLPVKTFIFSNEGYASIRMTQRNYFGGAYLGCDVRTGLGFPDWALLAKAFGLPYLELTQGLLTPGFDALFDSSQPAFFLVPIDPEQTYFPKITSRVTESGSMESNPLHMMSPDLPADLASQVFRFFPVK
ncbi:thiamine pyrophosphate-binding protein [Propionicimonas sp.]|uniref:thiamine pyrophosphate-binding protein n=1 Tax=Propionicimonas sp. TaxID=1955623 RepID=UPI0017A7C56B|nr:thiamine pyrophosphate-binding protein [Propionicimonas sp.]MBA3019903.1 thiamine pyrophosphate-binding protein [Propionicimonas sp.]MCG2805897.1 thiamine pyrophosphate-binding protein [Propionicimonas sp.]